MKQINMAVGQYRLGEESTTRFLTRKEFCAKVYARFADASKQLHLVVRATIEILVSDEAKEILNSSRSLKLILYPELANSTLWFPLAECRACGHRRELQ